jgi:uncharacterized protein
MSNALIQSSPSNVALEIKNLEDAEKLVTGAAIMGTGGGGDAGEGLRLLSEIIDRGKTIRIVGLDSLPSDSIVASPYFVGSVAPTARKKRITPKISNPIMVSMAQLESVLGRKISAVTATELGGLNTAVALHIGSQLGLPAVDGDLVGRAAPQINQSTAHLLGMPMSPAALCTESGNIVVVKEYGSVDDYEAIARQQAVIAKSYAAVVDTPLSKRKAKRAIQAGTISLCYRLGEAVIEARKRGKDPVKAIVKCLPGWRFFEGRVSRFDWKDDGGFLKAELILEGTDEFEGHKLKSWIMNEHIMAWRDGKPVVMPPDPMALVKADGGAVTNGQLRVGMKLTAIAAKAPKIWRTSRGLELFGPRHFGFDYDYKPVERLLET